MDESTCTIDGQGPFPVVRPATVAEVGETVRGASAEGRAVFPIGGRTMLGIGLPPSRPGIAVDLRGLDKVIDYPARDMTITVQPGITLARLRDLLRAEKQRLPIDVPKAHEATLGGALATNTSGPRRFGFGTLRDYVIGISVVSDEGKETKAGGRVVKNVAGYDLCKLHVGALGSLGIVAQVTLKLRPLPDSSALLVFSCPDGRLGECLDRLHVTRTRPVCLEVLNSLAARSLLAGRWQIEPTNWLVVVGFEESVDAVRWQVKQMIAELSAERFGGADILVDATAEPLWQALTELRLDVRARLTFKANLLPHSVADFCRQAAALSPSLSLQAHAGSGIVLGNVTGELTVEQAGEMLSRLQAVAGSAEGNVVVLDCPATWKASLPIWGRRRGDADLMAAVRDRLDPRRLFNPGRFLTR